MDRVTPPARADFRYNFLRYLLARFLHSSSIVEGRHSQLSTEVNQSRFYGVANRTMIQSRRLGKLRLEERVGTGGMAEIWRASTADGRDVAVKLLTPDRADDEGARRRFARECAITMDLRHTNASRGLDQGVCDGRQYLVVEYVQGPTLEELIASSKNLPKSKVISILRSVCSVLSDFHEREIFHRDLKPSNVMLSSEHDGDDALLIDFGIAAAPDFATLTKDRELLGTLQYMAPQQIYGSPISPLDIDLWGLSALAYETLTGSPAFDAPSLGELCAAIRNAKHERASKARPDLVEAIDTFFERCFAQEATDRFRSVSEWLAAFENAIAENGPLTRDIDRSQEQQAEIRSNHPSDVPSIRFPRLPEAINVGAANQNSLNHSKRNWFGRGLAVAAAAIFFSGVINIVDLGHLAAQWSRVWP